VILRALKLGDMLCAVPALRALRAAWPRAELVLVGLPWACEFVERFGHYLDGFREFPGYPGLPERTPRIDRIPGFLGELQAERFDLAIQLHGSGLIVNPLMELFGARACAGFYPSDGYCPDPSRFLPWPERGLEVDRLLSLAGFLGAPSQGSHLEFPLCDRDARAVETLAGPRGLRPGTYACVHPGASVPERRWPAERFAAVAKALSDRGLEIVLTGSSSESALTRAVAEGSAAPCLDLAGRTDLGSLAALIDGAALLVCNDTGVSHLAAARRVPSVVISTGENPDRWAPADRTLHRVLCNDSGISVEEVVGETDRLIRTATRPRRGGPVAGARLVVGHA
jgi:ADP-heptose:LPS heptosyltransferase